MSSGLFDDEPRPSGGGAARHQGLDAGRSPAARHWTATCLVAVLLASLIGVPAAVALDLAGVDLLLVWSGLFVIGLIADPLHAFSPAP